MFVLTIWLIQTSQELVIIYKLHPKKIRCTFTDSHQFWWNLSGLLSDVEISILENKDQPI